MTESAILTRRELYDLVWATPLSRLSEQFGISDRGLAKICERHRVPSPPRGYWAKLAAGASPKQTLFLEIRDASLNFIEINPSDSNIPDEAREILERAKLERRAAQVTQTQRASRTELRFQPVERVHPVLESTAKALRAAKLKETPMIALSGAGLATVWVSSDCVERALAFLDKLTRQLSAKGYTVEVAPQGIKVSQTPEYLVFTLKEKTELRPHEPTQEERLVEKRRQEQIAKSKANGLWEFWESKCAYPANDEIGTGNLILQIEGYSDGVRRRWADGKTQTLEMLFDGVVTGFEALLAARKAQRLEMEERERQRVVLAQRQQLARERRKREKKRKGLLKDLMAQTEEAVEIKKWLSTLELDLEEQGEFSRFMDWAKTRLAVLEAALSKENVVRIAKEEKLFPEIDDLHDPLGDPPRDYYYYGPESDE